jgi:hypothetical protein
METILIWGLKNINNNLVTIINNSKSLLGRQFLNMLKLKR